MIFSKTHLRHPPSARDGAMAPLGEGLSDQLIPEGVHISMEQCMGKGPSELSENELKKKKLSSMAFYMVPELTPEQCKQALPKLVAACTSEANQAALKEIRDHPDWDPVQKAHKEQLLVSKIYREPMKEFGFKSGPDAKKGVMQICDHHRVLTFEDDKEYQDMCTQIDVAFGIHRPDQSKTKEPEA